MGIGFAYQAAALDAIIGDAHVAGVPGTLWVALFTSVPSDALAGAEPSGGSYARVSVANDSAHWAHDTPGDRAVWNVTDIVFPTPSAGWGTIRAVGLMDASSGGQQVLWGTVPTLVVVSGFAPTILAHTTAIVTL